MQTQLDVLESILENNRDNFKLIETKTYKLDGVLAKGVQSYMPVIYTHPNSSVLSTTIHSCILSMSKATDKK